MNHQAVRSNSPPTISIVMPCYNRESLVGRAIKSCLAQDYTTFEIVVVDDASTDQSMQVVTGFSDARVRLVKHEANRGVCPARNTGADHARGDWIIFLDSDDELLPSAVSVIAERVRSATSDVGCIYFRCLKDDGSISPSIDHIVGKLDHAGYLEFMQACTGGSRDLLSCVRRTTFERVRFPDNHGLEDCYHLDFSQQYASIMSPEVIRLYHQDASNSLVKRTATFQSTHDHQFVRDRGDNIASALARHTPALRRHAPSLLSEYESRLLTLRLLANDRVEAMRALVRLSRYPRQFPKHLAIFAVGLTGPAWLETFRLRSRGLRERLVPAASASTSLSTKA